MVPGDNVNSGRLVLQGVGVARALLVSCAGRFAQTAAQVRAGRLVIVLHEHQLWIRLGLVFS